MNFGSVLIVTYGRSGSTLLQGILNGIEGCRVAGENNNFILGLYDSYRRLRQTQMDFGGRSSLSPASPWYGSASIDMERFFQHCRDLIRDVLAPDYATSGIQAYGFKEIRYLDVPNFFDYLNFLSRMLPNPCFVFLVRNVDDVMKSGWWSITDDEAARQKLAAFEQRANVYAQSNPGNTFKLTYEDMVARTSRLTELFDFLGADYDEDKVARIMAIPHSCSSQSIVARRTAAAEAPARNTGGPSRAGGARRRARVPTPAGWRKWTKFRRDPRRFFEDSPRRLIRLLGMIYLSISGRRRPAHAG